MQYTGPEEGLKEAKTLTESVLYPTLHVHEIHLKILKKTSDTQGTSHEHRCGQVLKLIKNCLLTSTEAIDWDCIRLMVCH